MLLTQWLVDKSIKIIRENRPTDGRPYYGCFSGGKDSVLLKAMAMLAGVKVDWHYNQTTIDPPELIRFIKAAHSDVATVKAKRGFFDLGREREFPTRLARWCCRDFKKRRSPKDRRLLMGIRLEESPQRAEYWSEKKRSERGPEYTINPILEWGSDELWTYIKENHVPYCSLYDEGFTRLGCVGCPLGSRKSREKEFKRWPGFEKAWRSLLHNVWERRKNTINKNGNPWFGTHFFQTEDEMWEWWMSDGTNLKAGARAAKGEGE